MIYRMCREVVAEQEGVSFTSPHSDWNGKKLSIQFWPGRKSSIAAESKIEAQTIARGPTGEREKSEFVGYPFEIISDTSLVLDFSEVPDELFQRMTGVWVDFPE